MLCCKFFLKSDISFVQIKMSLDIFFYICFWYFLYQYTLKFFECLNKKMKQETLTLDIYDFFSKTEVVNKLKCFAFLAKTI